MSSEVSIWKAGCIFKKLFLKNNFVLRMWEQEQVAGKMTTCQNSWLPTWQPPLSCENQPLGFMAIAVTLN